MSPYPKAPREMTGGMMWFPRMLDKIRLHSRGELADDYHKNLGHRKALDGICVNFLRIEYDNLKARVLEGGTDEEILEWCYDKGRRLNEGDIMVWNAFISKFGWNDFASGLLEKRKQEYQIEHRTDIITIPDLLDLDEKRRE